MICFYAKQIEKGIVYGAKTQDDLLSRQCTRIGSNGVTLFGQYVHATVLATQAVFKTAI